MRTIIGIVMIVAAVVGWILMKTKYGSAGIMGNIICICLTIGGHFLIWG